MDTIEVFGFNLICKSLDIVPTDQKILINTISPNSYGLSVKEPEMDAALKGSDYLVLDGGYFGIAPYILKRIKIKRITGWDCFTYFSDYANLKHRKVFFLGSTQKTLNLIQEKYEQDYPNTKVETYSPPFRTKFSESDLIKMRESINLFKPDVLFVGLTAPKQEIWGFQNLEHIDVNIICTIGNVFDWYAGISKRPGKFWQKAGLEWFVRIIYRPEVFRRNIANQMLFFWHLFLVILGIKKKN